MPMRIAYKGKFLRESLLAFGHQVYDLPVSRDSCLTDLLRTAPFPIEIVVWELYGGFSQPQALDRCDCPVAAYCIDTPINEFWLRHLGRNIDYLFVDQLQSVEALAKAGIRSTWLPLPAQESYFQPPCAKKYDLTFIGTVDANRLKRNNLLNLIKSRFNLNVMAGIPIPEAQKIFAQSKIILNENFFPGLTLRVLQGLAAGTVVFSEQSPYQHDFGLTHGKDLILYESGNILDLLANTLANYDQYADIAAIGQQTCRSLYASTNSIYDLPVRIVSGCEFNPRPSASQYLWHKTRADALYIQRYGGSLAKSVHQMKARADSRDNIAADALIALGDIQARVGKPQEARLNYRKALAISPDSIGHLKLALLDISQNDLRPALTSIQTWLNAHPAQIPGLQPQTGCLQASDLLLAVAEIYSALGKTWEMGFSKNFADPVPDAAFEQALLSWQQQQTPAALNLMLRSLEPFHMQGELLPYMLTAIRRGLLQDQQILATASLAHAYYDHATASTILKAMRGNTPSA